MRLPGLVAKRLEVGHTQHELAQKAICDIRTVQRAEAGEAIAHRKAEDIAAALGVNLTLLAGPIPRVRALDASLGLLTLLQEQLLMFDAFVPDDRFPTFGDLASEVNEHEAQLLQALTRARLDAVDNDPLLVDAVKAFYRAWRAAERRHYGEEVMFYERQAAVTALRSALGAGRS